MWTILPKISKAIKSKRLEFVAGELADIITKAQSECERIQRSVATKNCLRFNSQITVTGFSLGAHIGAFFCRLMNENSKNQTDKIAKLIG